MKWRFTGTSSSPPMITHAHPKLPVPEYSEYLQQPSGKRGPYTKSTAEQKAETEMQTAEHGFAATICVWGCGLQGIGMT